MRWFANPDRGFVDTGCHLRKPCPTSEVGQRETTMNNTIQNSKDGVVSLYRKRAKRYDFSERLYYLKNTTMTELYMGFTYIATGER